MDSPWRKPVRNMGKKFAGLQYTKDAKIQRPRHGLVEQGSFARVVENAATTAKDASKLQWDFGAAAEGPHPYTALEQEQKSPVNPILADAELMKTNPEKAGSVARVWRAKHDKKSYLDWLN